MILGGHRRHHVGGLGVEARGEIAHQCPVDVLLDRPVGERGPAGDTCRKGAPALVEVGVGEHPVDDAERKRVLGADPVAQQVQLLRLRRSDELGQEVAPAKVA